MTVRQEEAVGADLERRVLTTRADGREREHAYDYLILACGAGHAYFGRDEWEEFAPGLKTLAQATEIRRRVLSAYERAEVESDAARQRALLTFVVVGGGPTGVELAGALGEMSRFTLARDFRNIDPALARVILIEAGPRILPSFPESLARRAMRDLEALGVQVWTASPVTRIDATGVEVGRERIETATTLWAAGVEASPLGKALGLATDRLGRIRVGPDLALPRAPRGVRARRPGARARRERRAAARPRARRDAAGPLRGARDPERAASEAPPARCLRVPRPRADGDDRPQPRDLRHGPAPASAASRPGCSGSASTSTSWSASRTGCSWSSSGRGPISLMAAARA